MEISWTILLITVVILVAVFLYFWNDFRKSKNKTQAMIAKVNAANAVQRTSTTETRNEPAVIRVVTESCIRCKYTDCVDACPEDAFREGPNFLAIDPDSCTGCGKCDRECPINAIYPENLVSSDQLDFIAMNAELASIWPRISKRKDPLPDATDWATRLNKRQLLIR